MRMCMSEKCVENHTLALDQMIRLTTRIARILPKYVAESRKSTIITLEISYSTPASWTHRTTARTQRVLWNTSGGTRKAQAGPPALPGTQEGEVAGSADAVEG